VEASAGATLITEGEPGDCFYAIADGRVTVTKRGQDVATLGRGQGFGEIALIQDVPRTATVVALTDVSLYMLEKEPFVLALTGHAPTARAADDLVAQRLEELGEI
jgi:CRP-like cAMP-binding protein